jgi:hypothetical protein
MSLNSNNLPSNGKQIEPMEPATYPARTVCLADLGVQEQRPFQGKEKPPVNMIAITYEFSDEFLKDEDGNDIPDKPRWLTEMMPIYQLSADKAKSTLRYNALDPKNVHSGDFSALVDIPCLVTVVHNPNKKTGGVYENIGGVSPMRDKDAQKAPPLVSSTAVFDMDAPDLEVYQALPPFIQKKIVGGLEYDGSPLYELLGDVGNTVVGDSDEHVPDETPY